VPPSLQQSDEKAFDSLRLLASKTAPPAAAATAKRDPSLDPRQRRPAELAGETRPGVTAVGSALTVEPTAAAADSRPDEVADAPGAPPSKRARVGEAIVVTELSPAEYAELGADALRRLISADCSRLSHAHRMAYTQLLAHHAYDLGRSARGRGPASDAGSPGMDVDGPGTDVGAALRSELMDRIFASAASFRVYQPMLHAWALREFLAGSAAPNGGGDGAQGGVSQAYQDLVSRTVAGCKRVLGKNDVDSVMELVLRLPALTPDVIGLLDTYCSEDEMYIVGLKTLRELIVRRPTVRQRALQVPDSHSRPFPREAHPGFALSRVRPIPASPFPA
jgi:hypothetical protein